MRASVAERSSAATDRWGRRFIALAILSGIAGYAFDLRVTLAILTVASYAALVAGVQWPVLGFFGVGTLVTIDVVSREYLLTGGLFRWNTFNYLLIITMVLYAKRLLALTDVHHKLLVTLLALMVGGLAVTPDLAGGVQQILGIGATLGLTVHVLPVLRDGRAWALMAILSGILGAVCGIACIWQRGALPEINPNALVHLPLAALFVIALGVGYCRPRESWAAALLGGVNAVVVLLTGSRGGMLIAAVCLIYVILRLPQQRLRVAMLAASGAAALAMTVGFATDEAYAVGRISKSFDSQRTLAERTSGRSDLAIAAWRIWLASPLGVGTGGFADAFASSYYEDLAFAGRAREAHSGWAKILAENGVLGFVLTFCFVASFAAAGLHSGSRDLMMLGTMTSFALAVAFISTEFQNKELWFLASAVGLRLGNRALVAPRKRMLRPA